MTKQRVGAAVAGVCIIGLGVALLVANLKGWDQMWPAFLVLAGVAFLGGYIGSGFKDEGSAFMGTGLVLTGVFFFGFTAGRWEWAEMSKLWPVFPLIWGFAFVVMFIAQRRGRDWGALGVGLAAMIAGGVGLAYKYWGLTGDVTRYWPLLIVLVGVLALIQALVRGVRRQ